jgi:exosome complex component RRP4
MKKIIVPGDEIENAKKSQNTITINGKTYSTMLAIYETDTGKITPLEGLWHPERDDNVVGIVESSRLNSYGIDLNSIYKGIVISKYVEERLNIGDIVEATVRELDETGTVVLTRPNLLHGGKVIDIRASKIPRIIGKNEVMLKILTEGTGSMIKIGINGRIWIYGGNMALATEAILMITEEAHTSGLTDRIKKMLEANKEKTQK